MRRRQELGPVESASVRHVVHLAAIDRGSDDVNGGSGDDTVDEGSGFDTVLAGSGTDTLIYKAYENQYILGGTYAATSTSYLFTGGGTVWSGSEQTTLGTLPTQSVVLGGS